MESDLQATRHSDKNRTTVMRKLQYKLMIYLNPLFSLYFNVKESLLLYFTGIIQL